MYVKKGKHIFVSIWFLWSCRLVRGLFCGASSSHFFVLRPLLRIGRLQSADGTVVSRERCCDGANLKQNGGETHHHSHTFVKMLMLLAEQLRCKASQRCEKHRLLQTKNKFLVHKKNVHSNEKARLQLQVLRRTMVSWNFFYRLQREADTHRKEMKDVSNMRHASLNCWTRRSPHVKIDHRWQHVSQDVDNVIFDFVKIVSSAKTNVVKCIRLQPAMEAQMVG